MRLLPIVLAAMLLLAGCLGSPETPQQNASPQDEESTAPDLEDAGNGTADAGADPEPHPQASVSVGNVGYDYSDERDRGTIRGVQIEVQNTGNVAVEPRLRITVTVDGDEIYADDNVTPRFGSIEEGDTAGQRLSIERTIRRQGQYQVTVAVTTTDGEVLDEASRTFSVF